jgi:hypothetical protein
MIPGSKGSKLRRKARSNPGIIGGKTTFEKNRHFVHTRGEFSQIMCIFYKEFIQTLQMELF